MKRQHPYNPKCRCQRCKAVKALVEAKVQLANRRVFCEFGSGRIPTLPALQNIPIKRVK